MKTFGYLLMAVMACMTCSCRDEEPLPDPVPPVMEPENPGNPEEPDTGKVYLGIAPIIENMQEQRAVVENWKEGHCLGVTAAGDVNIPFTFDGRRWKAGKQVEVTAEQKVSAYYPYNVQYTDMTAIPVAILPAASLPGCQTVHAIPFFLLLKVYILLFPTPTFRSDIEIIERFIHFCVLGTRIVPVEQVFRVTPQKLPLTASFPLVIQMYH
jgi:hypothetical protein